MQQADNLTAAHTFVRGFGGLGGLGGLILQVSDHNFVGDVTSDKTRSLSGQKELQSEIICCSFFVSICLSGYGWIMSCVITCRLKKMTNFIESYFFMEVTSYNMADLYWSFGGTCTGGSRFHRNNCTCPLKYNHVPETVIVIVKDLICITGKKSEAIPVQAWTDPEGWRMLRLQDFMTIGTWRW